MRELWRMSHLAADAVIKTTESLPTRMICLFLCGWLWEENEDESEFAL